jgi:hypothetical protein
MEPLTATDAAASVAKYVVPAAAALGAKVWDRASDTASDQAADTAVGFGRRLLQRLVPHRTSEQQKGQAQPGDVWLREKDVIERVDALQSNPEDTKAVILAEGAIEALLAADPALLAAISHLLDSAPKTGWQHSDRSVSVGRDNPGVIVTGHSNTVHR